MRHNPASLGELARGEPVSGAVFTGTLIALLALLVAITLLIDLPLLGAVAVPAARDFDLLAAADLSGPGPYHGDVDLLQRRRTKHLRCARDGLTLSYCWW